MRVILQTQVRTGRAWPSDAEHVTYGPFDTASDARNFHTKGVNEGYFTELRNLKYLNAPILSHHYKSTATVVR